MENGYIETINFDPTYVGESLHKTLLRNKDVVIQRHALTKSNPSHFQITSGSIVYKPKLPNELHVDFYEIVDPNGVEVVRLIGESLGPKVYASVRYLYFYRLKNDMKTKAVFELKNDSNIHVKFQFDIDNTNSPITVSPRAGEILPLKQRYIKISFVNNKPGIYFDTLFCLVHHHKPVAIEIMGVNLDKLPGYLEVLKKSQSKILMRRSYMDEYITDHFGGVVADLSSSYVNLNFADVPLKINSSTSAFVNLINQTDKCLKVEWFINNEEKCFSVNPVESCIYPRQTTSYEFKYIAREISTIGFHTFYGRITLFEYTKDLHEVPIPVPLKVHVLGNSFPPSVAWFPQIEVPKSVTMPITCINVPCFTSFIIERAGSFPTSFAFTSPNSTYFSVKPKIGLIRGSFQLINVKFLSPVEGSVSECWSLRLNDAPENDMIIKFCGLAELPCMVVGESNEVFFDNVYPGCEQIKTVKLKNLNHNEVRYKFCKNEWVRIENPIGTIIGYDECTIKFILTASYNMPETFEVDYRFYVLLEKYVEIGVAVRSVIIHATTSYSKIIALPSFLNIGDIVGGVVHTTYFNVFNLGTSLMHFKLVLNNKSNDIDYQIVPNVGTLGPKENLKLRLNIKTAKKGLYFATIIYYVLKNVTTDEVVDNKCPVWRDCGTLCKCQLYAFYPTLKIVDMFRNRCGPLFGTFNIWEMLDIDRLNFKLQNIECNEVYIHKMSVPVAEVNKDIQKSVVLIIKNMSNKDTVINISRIQMCDCKPVAEHKSFSRRVLVDRCPHKDLVNFSISEEHITAYSISYITITINYNLPGINRVGYALNLTENRKIQLIITIRGLENSQHGDMMPYTSRFSVRFFPYYIGQRRPQTKTFVFYNNSKHHCRYELDTTEIDKLNKEYRCKIFVCTNPVGIIEPKSFTPLFFQICPIQMRRYTLKLPLLVDEQERRLKIIFEGVPHYKEQVARVYGPRLYDEDHYLHPGSLVSMSAENLILKCVYENSIVTNMIFLRNISKTNTVAFCFEFYSLQNVMEVTVDPCKGVLGPGQSVPLIFQMNTFSRSCASRVQVCCYLLNYDIFKRHLKSKELYHKRALNKQQEFDITDTKQSQTFEPSFVNIKNAPKILHSTISTTFNIVDYEDRDILMTLPCQLRQTPLTELCLTEPTEPCQHGCQHIGCAECLKLTQERVILFSAIMESMIYNDLHSNMFKFQLEIPTCCQVPYYSQYKFDNDQDLKKHIKLVFDRIPSIWLFEILRNLIETCVCQHFKLPQCTSSNEDMEMSKQRRERYSGRFAFLFDLDPK